LLLEILPNPESFVHADFVASGIAEQFTAAIKTKPVFGGLHIFFAEVPHAKFAGKLARESIASTRHWAAR
jgi:hypothetical protein